MVIRRLFMLFPFLILSGLSGCGMAPADGGDETSAGGFTVYSAADSLISDAVTDIAVDLYRAGVWVATAAGISYYSMTDSSWTEYGASSALPSLEVNAVIVNLGTVWVGTESGPASFADSIWKELSNPAVLPGLRVNAIAADGEPDYALWFGTSGGAARRSLAGIFTTYDTQNGLSANDIVAIARDASGNIWVGTSVTLDVFDGSSWDTREIPLSNVFIQSIHGGESGSVWVGTSGGIVRFTGSESRTYGTGDGLPSASVNDFAEDFDHTLWAATDGGIAWLDSTVWRELSLPDEVSGRRVTAVASDALTRSLWIGTAGGLVRYRPE